MSSNKYRELVKKSGQPAPEAVVVVHSLESGNGNGNSGGGATTRSQAAAAAKKKKEALPPPRNVLPVMAKPTTSDAATAAAFRVAAPNGVTFAAGNDMEEDEEGEEGGANADGGGGDNSSGWETASDDESEIEPWDPTVSLFDNKKFETKIRSGLVPLYTRGDDEGAGKQFHSLHAVQRHMVDLGNCRVCWEGNEDEYAEWYEWSDDDDDDAMDYSDNDDDDDAVANNSTNDEAFELALPNGKVIGARAFAKFYKQSHRPFPRAAAAANGGRAGQHQQRVLSGAGAAARAANLGSGLPGSGSRSASSLPPP